MKVLITGISGFVGSWLSEYCLKKGCEVFGLIRHRSNLKNIEEIKDKLRLYEGDITDTHSVSKVVSEIKPDKIFHLAAQSFVPYSWLAPEETMRTNVLGTVNILEATKKYAPGAVVQLAGSSEEYGLVEKHEIPLNELSQLRPMSPYAVSKVTTDLLGWQYHKSLGLKIIRTRAFNHTGPRRGEEFVVSQFIKQALLVRKAKKERIIVGNLEAVRDFTDVRDVVKAYWVATEVCDYGEVYNICSGVGVSIQLLLDMVIDMVLGGDDSAVKQDKSKIRPSDVPILIGDCSKFKKKTGWEPKIDFISTLGDTIRYMESRV